MDTIVSFIHSCVEPLPARILLGRADGCTANWAELATQSAPGDQRGTPGDGETKSAAKTMGKHTMWRKNRRKTLGKWWFPWDL